MKTITCSCSLLCTEKSDCRTSRHFLCVWKKKPFCLPTAEQDSEEDVDHWHHCDIRNRYKPMSEEDFFHLLPVSLRAIIEKTFLCNLIIKGWSEVLEVMTCLSALTPAVPLKTTRRQHFTTDHSSKGFFFFSQFNILVFSLQFPLKLLFVSGTEVSREVTGEQIFKVIKVVQIPRLFVPPRAHQTLITTCTEVRGHCISLLLPQTIPQHFPTQISGLVTEMTKK